MDAIGVFNSWVTALMKLSCFSLRRISRTRKIVLRTRPATMAPKKNDAEKNFDALTPVEDDPPAADRERHRRQANAQREEEINRFLPADDPHREIVAGQVAGVR